MIDFLNDNRIPFNEYLNRNNRDKFSIVITKSQYATKMGLLTHEELVKFLINKTRPDIETDSWGNSINGSEPYNGSNIIMSGFGNYGLVELPTIEMLSPEQFNCLKEVLLAIKTRNEEIDKKGYGEKFRLDAFGVGNIKVEYDNYQDKIDELIENLGNFVKEPELIKKEVIIGKPIALKHYKSVEEIEMEKLLQDMYDYSNDKDTNKTKIKGFSTISLILVVTLLSIIGILVLGIMFNTL